jgi:MBG domain (YGX type)
MVNAWGYFAGAVAGTPIGDWPDGQGGLTVTGTQGSNTLTVNSVNVGVISDYQIDTVGYPAGWAIVVLGDDGVYRVYTVYALNTSTQVLSIYPFLASSVTSQPAANVYDSKADHHLTAIGYYGLADYVVAQTKGASYLKAYATRYVSDGLGNYSGSAWTAIDGLNQGAQGNVPPTNCMTQGVFPDTSNIDYTVCNAYSGTDRTEISGSTYQTLIGATVPGQGAKLTASLHGRSGYLDTFVGIEGQYQSEQAAARVQVYIDGALVLNENFGGLTHIQVPFLHAQSGEIDVTVDSPFPCAPRISNTNWYVWNDADWNGVSPSDPLIPNGANVLVIMDSWGIWHDGAFVTRLAQDLPGSSVTNVSQDGKTAAWAITNFSTLTAGGAYDYIISDFQINDLHPSIGGGLTDAMLLSNMETLWELVLGTGATPIYLRSLSTDNTAEAQRLNQWDQSLTANYPTQMPAQQPQTITFPNPGTQVYGGGPISLTATASSNLPVSYTVISGPASISGSVMTILGAGLVTVEADQSGNSNWLPASPVQDTLTVNPATLMVTADNKTATEGDGLPTFTASYSGFVNGDNQGVLSGVPNFSTDAPSGPPVGTWNILVTQGTLAATNYTFTFVNGTLTVNPAVAQITAPLKNTMLSGSSVPFSWSHETNAVNYQLLLGSTPGGSDIASVTTPNLNTTVNGLPTDGSYIFATLSGTVDGTNYTVQDTGLYVAYGPIAVMMNPIAGASFTGTSVTFNWVAGASSSAYWIDVGSTQFGNNYYQSGNLGGALTATVNGLPNDGSTVYVTLWSLVGGNWQYNTYTYTAYNNGSTKGVMQTPTPGSTLSGSTVTFTWSAGTGATAYWLDAGSTPFGNNYYQSGNLGNVLTTTANGLPTDGSTVYVTLYSLVGGQWVSNQYTYTAYSASGATGQITTPTPGSTFTGSTVTFNWTAGTGSSAYWLDIGSVPGGNQYYQSGNLGNVLTTTANGLPTDGSTVYVTLYSLVGGQWVANAYTYTAFSGTGALGIMQTPPPGSTLSGNQATFTWSAGTGATAYWLDIGSNPGGNQYYQSGNLGNVLTTTVYSLPADGSQIYVTLYSLVGGQWLSNAYTYTSGP